MHTIKRTICLILTFSIPASHCVAAPCIQSTLSSKISSISSNEVTQKKLPQKRLNDERYRNILTSAKTINPNLDEHFLYGLYKGKIKKFKEPTHDATSNMRTVIYSEERDIHFDTFEEERDWIQRHPAGVITKHPFLTKLQSQCGIHDSFLVAERTIIENPESAVDDQGHISEGTYIVRLHTPPAHADCIEFLLCIGESATNQILSTSQEDVKKSFATDIRILGERYLDIPLGGKERSFMTFEKVNRPFPKGVVLSSDLVAVFTRLYLLNNFIETVSSCFQEMHNYNTCSPESRANVRNSIEKVRTLNDFFKESVDTLTLTNYLQDFLNQTKNKRTLSKKDRIPIKKALILLVDSRKQLENDTDYFMPHIESMLGTQGVELNNKTYSRGYRDPGSTEWLAIRSNPRKSMPGILDSEKVHNSENIGQHIGKLGAQWFSNRAYNYRERMAIPHTFTLSLIIQQYMPGEKPKYGQTDTLYGAGVFYTRNPNTGEKGLHGRFIKNADGEKLMTGGSLGNDISILQTEAPELYKELLEVTHEVVTDRGFPQQIEFVIHDSKTWYLQTRAIRFSIQGECSFIYEKLNNEEMSPAVAVARLTDLCTRIDNRKMYKLDSRIPQSPITEAHHSTPGAMYGHIAYTPENAVQLVKEGKSVIAVLTPTTREEFLNCMFNFPTFGFVTTYGSDSSHEADLAREASVPSLINLKNTRIDGGKLVCNETVIESGEMIGISGKSKILFKSKTNPLIEDRIVSDMSGGIDIRVMRSALEKLHKNSSVRTLIRENARLAIEWNRLKFLGESTFICNIKKHILHKILFDKVKSSSTCPKNEIHEKVDKAICSAQNNIIHSQEIAGTTIALSTA